MLSGDAVHLLFSDGAGAFSNAVSFTLPGSGAASLAVADFNKDLKSDLAIVDADANALYVLRGNGAGSLTNTTTYTVGAAPGRLAVADVNGDGRPDVITANHGDGTLSVLTNAAGALVSAGTVGLSGSPSAVAVADLDKNGKTDLIVALDESELVVLPGNGNGTFTFLWGDATTAFTVGEGSKALALGDYNNDKLIDVAVLSDGDDTVTLLLNNYAPRAYSQKLVTREDSPLPLSLTGTHGPLDYVIVGGPTNGTFTPSVSLLNNTAGVAGTYTPVADSFGNDQITFYVSDTVKTSKWAKISIKVLPVNDQPAFTLAASAVSSREDTAVKLTNFVTNVVTGPANEAKQAVKYLLTAADPALFAGTAGQPKIGGGTNRVLQYTPAKNATGSTLVTMTVLDGGGTNNGGTNLSAPQTFTVTVTNVNDAPILTPATIVARTIAVNSSTTYNLAVTDLDNALTGANLSVISTNTALVSAGNIVSTLSGTNWTVTVTPAVNTKGKTLLTFTVNDGSGANVSRTATLTVK